MEKTKLFALLHCLDPKERRWVAGYFCQPCLAEKHATWQQLLNYLLDQTLQSQPKIDRKTIFALLFGTKTPYDDLKMRHIATNVLQQVETALAYYYAQRDDVLWLQFFSKNRKNIDLIENSGKCEFFVKTKELINK